MCTPIFLQLLQTLFLILAGWLCSQSNTSLQQFQLTPFLTLRRCESYGHHSQAGQMLHILGKQRSRVPLCLYNGYYYCMVVATRSPSLGSGPHCVRCCMHLTKRCFLPKELSSLRLWFCTCLILCTLITIIGHKMFEINQHLNKWAFRCLKTGGKF